MKHRTTNEEISELGTENNPIQESAGEDERTVVPDQTSLPGQRDLLRAADANTENDPSATLSHSFATWRVSAVTWISLELRKCNPCIGVCACVCHVHHKVQTPQILHRLIRNLLIDYAEMSF